MRTLGLFLLVATVLAACGDDDAVTVDTTQGANTPAGDARQASDRERASGVRRSIVTLTDPSRPTPATADAPARPQRELATHLYEPRGAGPFPLIVFAHGLNGHPRKFTRLHTAWAEAGYVVAAPTFPLSNDGAPGGGQVLDLAEQPPDMAFVLDELLGPDSPLTVRVDPDRVGAGGLSLGGATVYGLVYDDCCRDDRIGAAMVLDGNQLAFTTDLTRGPPLLLAHAEDDRSLPYDNARANFDTATVPAALLTLHETAHAEPYEDVVDPADEVVERVTVAWWDEWLERPADPATARDARARQAAAVSEAGGVASLQRQPG